MMDAKEQKRFAKLLFELASAIEELILSGTTAESKTTREKLAITFKEASRARMPRLGNTLRITLQQLEKLKNEGSEFEHARLSLFLNRSWLLANGIARALEANDSETFERLTNLPPAVPVERVEVVTLGVFRRVVPNAFSVFEMRLRVRSASAELTAGQAASWSVVFPAKPGTNVPPEALLALEQPKHKFRPVQLLEKRVFEATNVMVANGRPARISFGPNTELTFGDELEDWSAYVEWDREGALARIDAHEADPMALPNELSEEAVFEEWSIGAFEDVGLPYEVASLEADGLTMELRVDDNASHVAKALKQAAKLKTKQPALYGFVHYEHGRAVLTPLGLLRPEGPEYITIAEANINKAALVKALKIR